MSESKNWIVMGEATVSVSLSVQAASAEEALAKANEAMSYEWTCDEVDGEVRIIDEPPYCEEP